MPSIEWFEQQTQAYRDQVIPPMVKARVSVEAGIRQGWREYVGDAGRMVSLEHFGASADGARIFKELGIHPRGGRPGRQGQHRGRHRASHPASSSTTHEGEPDRAIV